MKTNHYTKQILLAMAILMFSHTAAMAQFQGIDILAGFAPDTTIIREWQSGYTLIYSASNSNGNWYHLVKSGAATFNSIQTSDTARDIEILGDTAYFCGNDANGNPIIGYFDLPTLLTSSPMINKVHAGAAPYHPKRMEVFYVADGLHIVMVGDYSSSSGTDRFLADLSHYNPTDSWNLFYFPDAVQMEYFDDIATTDNYVVTAGHKHLGHAIYMRMFNKPTTAQPGHHITSIPNNSIFWDPSNIQNYIFCSVCDFDLLYENTTEYPVWITHTTGDSVAIAYLSRDLSSRKYGIALRIFETTPPPNNWTIADNLFIEKDTIFDTSWRVKDLRYSLQSDKILMLRDYQGKSILTLFPNATPTAATNSHDNYGILQHSLDHLNSENNGVVTSGKNTDIYWLKTNLLHKHCYYYDSPAIKQSSCVMAPFDKEIADYHFSPTISTYSCQFTTTPLNTMCQ